MREMRIPLRDRQECDMHSGRLGGEVKLGGRRPRHEQEMTLILTEISCHGIAMAADSAVTEIYTATGAAVATPNAARKLQPVPHLRAGLSCWGMGEIEDIPTDQWLE